MFTVFRSLSQSPKAQDEAKNSYDLNSGLEEMPFRRIHTKGDKREDVCLKVLCTLYQSTNKVDNRLIARQACYSTTFSTTGTPLLIL